MLVCLFQSLFSWMALFNKDRKTKPKPPFTFQSLFSWMALFNGYEARWQLQLLGVSILVFMDGPLQQRVYETYKDEFYGFNPCFHGWPSSTGRQISVIFDSRGFNPCFHGWPSSTSKVICPWSYVLGVSILVFMDGPLQLQCDFYGPHGSRSFNPCFHGWPSSTILHRGSSVISISVSILVFMDGPLQHFE